MKKFCRSVAEIAKCSNYGFEIKSKSRFNAKKRQRLLVQLLRKPNLQLEREKLNIREKCGYRLKVSGHQVGQIGGFCAKASDIQKFVTLRILHRFFQDLKSEKFGPLGVRPCQQKFLPLLDRRNF